jgi:A/G-specific adenine glycosylase
VRRRRAKAPEFHEQAAIIARRGRYLLVRRPMTGLLAGLWGWPAVVVPAARARCCAIEGAIRERFGLAITCAASVATVRHDFTHRRLWVHVYRAARVTGSFRPADGVDARWVTVRQLAELPLSKLDRKIIAADHQHRCASRQTTAGYHDR